jgi:hypothetical protein
MINPVDRANPEYATKVLEAFERLQNNEDYKLVIVNGYCKDEALRLASLLSNDYLISQGKRQLVMEGLTSISYFDQYLRDIEGLRPAPDDDSEE